MSFPDNHPISPNFSHPMKRDSMQCAIFLFHLEGKVLTWLNDYSLEWYTLVLVLDFILVGKLKFSLPEFWIPADAREQLVNRDHDDSLRNFTVMYARFDDSVTSNVTGKNCSISHIAVRACSETWRVLNEPPPKSAR
jgi:hypothetical protein